MSAAKPPRAPPPLPEGAAGEAKARDEDLARFHDFCRRGETELAAEAMAEDAAYATAVGSLGNTAAHWAATSGHADVLQAAIDAGAGVNVTNDVGETPLHLAAWRGHRACVEVLLQAGADRTVKNAEGKTPPELVRHDEVREVLPEFDATALSSLIQIANSDDESDDE